MYAACEPVCLCVHVHVLCKDRERGQGKQSPKWEQSPVHSSKFQLESAQRWRLAGLQLWLACEGDQDARSGFSPGLWVLWGEAQGWQPGTHTFLVRWLPAKGAASRLPMNLPSLSLQIFSQEMRTGNQKLFNLNLPGKSQGVFKIHLTDNTPKPTGGAPVWSGRAVHCFGSQDRCDAGE